MKTTSQRFADVAALQPNDFLLGSKAISVRDVEIGATPEQRQPAFGESDSPLCARKSLQTIIRPDSRQHHNRSHALC